MNTVRILFVVLLLFVFSLAKLDRPFFLSAIHENENAIVLKKIEIPSLDLYLPLKTSPVEGMSWLVSDERTVFFGEGTSYPGKPGTTVLFAHAKNGLFAHLPNVSIDDEVLVQSERKVFTYFITDMKIIDPFDISFIRHDSSHELVLITCFGIRDEKRLAVFASLKDITMRRDERPIDRNEINFMLTTRVFDAISKPYNFAQLKVYGPN